MNRILNFHQVNNPKWFDGLICSLMTKYDFITVDTLYKFYSGDINLQNSCLLTADDGDRSFYESIFPVLKKYNVPAFICVSPKICKEKSNYWFQEIIGYDHTELTRIIADVIRIPFHVLIKYNPEMVLKTLQIDQILEIIKIYRRKNRSLVDAFQNMTTDNLKEVEQSGLVTIAAHTLNHPVLKNENDNTIRTEIKQSINELSDLLNHEINYFVYPNGIPSIDFTEREEDYLRNIGIRMAFTTQAGNLTPGNNLMRIPRFGLADTEAKLRVRFKMFTGTYWNTLSMLNPWGEFRIRKKLYQIVNKDVGG